VKPVVLYEDRLAPDTKPTQFGLHQLALACVADRRNAARWQLCTSFDARPCKGLGNLVKELELRRHETTPLVAAIDHDEIRLKLRLPPDACKRRVLEKLREHHPTARVVLVLENTEDVLTAVRAALGQPALGGKPTPKERDKVLHALADAPAERRVSFLAAYEPFDRLVRILTELLDANPPAVP
jgi:hypothetical protein